MKLFAKFDNEICEVLRYQNTRSDILLKSPTEGLLRVQKNEIELVGFKNGKGDTGELKILK